MTTPFTRRELAFFFASLYLGVLFVSCIIMWWVILIGGSPFTAWVSGFIDSSGNRTMHVQGGRRLEAQVTLCSSKEMTIEFGPSIFDDQEVWYPIPSGFYKLPIGCKDISHSFFLPYLPPGHYSYRAIIKFQNNLVGRDESFEVTPSSFNIDP